ncbi:hypothetical protein HRbin17_02722 [bacterium HR17]|uniref:CRISPR system Cms protein Csm5 n=1 Tax=Candidatus Fervidibacter japonicus TaxID=2035412 RepID=A0A2H5XG73_9BACT|nr:hypothetical protein HRbin17_02722 [bacterium HR17]
MKWNKPLTLTVQTLSPVAIGTGEKCNALGFLIDDNKVSFVDGSKFVRALSAEQQQAFLGWIDECIQQSRRPSLRNFLQQFEAQQRSTVLETIKAATDYAVSLSAASQRVSQINICLKTPDHKPYIPGSELKGAIRTAVLTRMLEGSDLLAQLVQSLTEQEFAQLVDKIVRLQKDVSREKDAKRRKEPNQLLRNLQEDLRKRLANFWRETEQSLLCAGKSDAHFDLFRGIAISDSEPLPTSALCIYAAKRLDRNGQLKVFTTFVEAIAPDNETTVTLFVAKPDRWLQEMGLTDKKGWLDWQKLAEALYEHANAVLGFIAQKFPNMRQRVQALKSQNTEDAPLVCLGWGQGFVSITMTDPLRKAHPAAYEALRQAMAQAIRQYERTKPNNFPKTIWVALDANNQPSDLFGWVKLKAEG